MKPRRAPALTGLTLLTLAACAGPPPAVGPRAAVRPSAAIATPAPAATPTAPPSPGPTPTPTAPAGPATPTAGPTGSPTGAPTAAPTPAPLAAGAAIAVLPDGTVLATDGDRILATAPDGAMRPFAGTGADAPTAADGAPAATSPVRAPAALQADAAGNVTLLSDGSDLLRIGPDGRLRRLYAGSRTAAPRETLYAMAVDGAGGAFLAVSWFDDAGGTYGERFQLRYLAPGAAEPDWVEGFDGVAIAALVRQAGAGDVLMVPRGGGKLYRLAPAGGSLLAGDWAGVGERGAVLDRAGRLYAVVGGRVARIDLASGERTPVAIDPPPADPYALDLDAAGALYVADAGRRVLKVSVP